METPTVAWNDGSSTVSAGTFTTTNTEAAASFTSELSFTMATNLDASSYSCEVTYVGANVGTSGALTSSTSTLVEQS